MNLPAADSTEAVPGSRPLKIASQERYAHARAWFRSQTEAARVAGFSHRSGQCSKWERLPDVQDRIAFLSRDPEEVTRAKREEIESYLWFAFRADRSVFFDEHRQLRPFSEIGPEYRQLIEGLTFTEKGKPNLKLVSPSFALVELRKFLGLDAPAKFAPTTPDGSQSYSSGAHEFLEHVVEREAARIAAEAESTRQLVEGVPSGTG